MRVSISATEVIFGELDRGWTVGCEESRESVGCARRKFAEDPSDTTIPRGISQIR